MLNMLIAIMGDTFSRVIEDKDVNTTKTKLALMADLKSIMHRSIGSDALDIFLFVASPTDLEAISGEGWEGAFGKLNKLTENLVTSMENNLRKEIMKAQEQIETMDKRETVSDQNMTKMISSRLNDNNKFFMDQKKLLEKGNDDNQKLRKNARENHDEQMTRLAAIEESLGSQEAQDKQDQFIAEVRSLLKNMDRNLNEELNRTNQTIQTTIVSEVSRINQRINQVDTANNNRIA